MSFVQKVKGGLWLLTSPLPLTGQGGVRVDPRLRILESPKSPCVCVFISVSRHFSCICMHARHVCGPHLACLPTWVCIHRHAVYSTAHMYHATIVSWGAVPLCMLLTAFAARSRYQNMFMLMAEVCANTVFAIRIVHAYPS